MVELRTEEEQVAAIKGWWQKHGRTTLIGILVAFAAYAGWTYYQQSQLEEIYEASAYYQRILAASSQPSLSEENITAIRQDAARLISDYESSTYAQYAALMLAKLAIIDNDMAGAQTQLRWVMDHAETTSELHRVATIRLATVLIGTEAYDEALSILVDHDDAWQSRRLEVKGDVYVAQGNLTEARTAYQRSLELASAQGINTGVLTLKLEDLAVQ